jgi:hypothetical protein
MLSTMIAVFVAFVFSLLTGLTVLGLWNWLHPTHQILIDVNKLVSC